MVDIITIMMNNDPKYFYFEMVFIELSHYRFLP